MKKIAGILCLFILFSCSSRSADVRKDQPEKVAVYNFNYAPYEKLNVPDKQLYNYAFNIIRNKLVYFVKKTFSSYPEPVGLVLELTNSSRQADFEPVLASPILRGWSVYDNYVMPLPAQDITDINVGEINEKVVLSAKASYCILVSDNKAAIYVSYWMLQYWNYKFIYYVEKNTNWSIVQVAGQ